MNGAAVVFDGVPLGTLGVQVARLVCSMDVDPLPAENEEEDYDCRHGIPRVPAATVQLRMGSITGPLLA